MHLILLKQKEKRIVGEYYSAGQVGGQRDGNSIFEVEVLTKQNV